MTNKRANINMGSFVVAIFVFMLFSILLMAMAQNMADGFDKEIDPKYNETFNEIGRLEQLANDLDVSKQNNQTTFADKIEEKFSLAFGALSVVPTSVDIARTMMNEAADLMHVDPLFVRVATAVMLILVFLAILAIFLKTNRL